MMMRYFKKFLQLLLTVEIVAAMSRYITIRKRSDNTTVHLIGSLHNGPESPTLNSVLESGSVDVIDEMTVKQIVFLNAISKKSFNTYYTEIAGMCEMFKNYEPYFYGTEMILCRSFAAQNRTELRETLGFESFVGQTLLLSYPSRSVYAGQLRPLYKYEVQMYMNFPRLMSAYYPVVDVQNYLLRGAAHVAMELVSLYKPQSSPFYTTRNWQSFYARHSVIAGVNWLWSTFCFGIYNVNKMQDTNLFNQQVLPSYAELFRTNSMQPFEQHSCLGKTLTTYRDEGMAEHIHDILEGICERKGFIYEAVAKAEASVEAAYKLAMAMNPALQMQAQPQAQPLTFDGYLRQQRIAEKMKKRDLAFEQEQCFGSDKDIESKDTLVVVGMLHLPGIIAFAQKNPDYEIVEHDVEAIIEDALAPYPSKKWRA